MGKGCEWTEKILEGGEGGCRQSKEGGRTRLQGRSYY